MPPLASSSAACAEHWGEGMFERLRRAYPLKLELLPLLLALWTSYFVLSTFPALPTQVPTHFNAAGEPDRWGPKAVLLLLWGVQLGLIYIPTTLMALAFGLAGDFRPLVNIPGRSRGSLTTEQGEAVRSWVLRLLLVDKVLAMALVAVILYSSIEIARGRGEFMSSLFWALIAALLSSSLFILWRLLRAAYLGGRSSGPSRRMR